MSDEGVEVVLFDDGKGERYAIPVSELGQFRLPAEAEVDEPDVEGYILTQQFLPHTSGARVRYPMIYDKSKGTWWATSIPAPTGTGGPAGRRR